MAATNNQGLNTLLGFVPESKFVFCIEASALSLPYLSDIKRHVVEALMEIAENRNGAACFNVIVFNEEITLWSNELVRCTPETVSVCSDWLKHIHSQSTANTLDALLAALTDKSVEAVYLIACGPPDQEKDHILDHLAHVSLDRPVHCRLVLGRVDETRHWKLMEQKQQATDILESIARDTEASFLIVEPKRSATVTHLPPGSHQMGSQPQDRVLRTENGHVFPANMSNVSVTTTLKGDPVFKQPKLAKPEMCSTKEVDYPCYHPYSRWPQVPYPPYTTWSRYSMTTNRNNMDESMTTQDIESSSNIFSSFKGISHNASALILGRKVLARSVKDGLYYLGIIKSQKDNDIFLISYAPVDNNFFENTEYQSTRLLELSDYEDAFRHCILPGDRVLAPNPDREQGKPLTYFPGTVLEGSACRDGIGIQRDTVIETTPYLTIAFTAPANRTVSVESDQPVFIPEPLFRRLCLEGAMPPNARQTLANVLAYPEKSLPGYPTSGSKRLPHDYQVVRPKVLKGKELQVDHLLPPFCLPVYPVMEAMDRSAAEVTWIPDWYAVGEAVGSKTESNRLQKDQEKVPGTKWTVRGLREEVEKVLQLRPGESVTLDRKRGLSTVAMDRDTSGTKSTMSDGKKTLSSHEENQSNSILSTRSLEKELANEFEWIKDIDSESIDSHRSRCSSSSGTRSRAIPCPNGAPPLREDRHYDRTDVKRELAKLRGSSSYSADKPKSILRRPRSVDSGGAEIGCVLGQGDIEKEARERRKLEHKRALVMDRLMQEEGRFIYNEQKQERFVDRKREQMLSRIENENGRLRQEHESIDRAQDHKRQVIHEIRCNLEKVQAEQEKKLGQWAVDRRVDFKRKKEEQREQLLEERNAIIQKSIMKKEELRSARDQARWNRVHERIMAEDSKANELRKSQDRSESAHRMNMRLMLGPEAQISSKYHLRCT